MSHFLRYRSAGGTYFFTVVTHERRHILTADMARGCLRRAIKQVRAKWPFSLTAIVLLPDHFHAVIELPAGDADYSLRLQKIKEHFTRQFLAAGGGEGRQTDSRRRHQERSVWQRRFWEHTVRDEDDLKRCVDYIHWNPVKHGLVARVADYAWSSFHRYVKLGEYDVDWGSQDPCPNFTAGE